MNAKWNDYVFHFKCDIAFLFNGELERISERSGADECTPVGCIWYLLLIDFENIKMLNVEIFIFNSWIASRNVCYAQNSWQLFQLQINISNVYLGQMKARQSCYLPKIEMKSFAFVSKCNKSDLITSKILEIIIIEDKWAQSNVNSHKTSEMLCLNDGYFSNAKQWHLIVYICYLFCMHLRQPLWFSLCKINSNKLVLI